MAQPLENRIAAALRASSRLKDVEATIADVQNEIASTRKSLKIEQDRSVDPALTTPQAREARSNAADLEHDIRRLEVSSDMLQARRQAILDDESYARRRDRYDKAERERDGLAAWIRERYSVIVIEILNHVQRIQENDAELTAVNRDRPRDKAPLESAERLARGIEPSGYWSMEKGGSPATWLRRMVLPLPFSDGMALPLPDYPQRDRRAMQVEEFRAMMRDAAGADATDTRAEAA